MKNLFGFLLLPLFLIADIAPPIQCETPTWVKETPFSLEPQPVHPSQINEKNLLFDTQYHLDEKTFFFHRVVKILTPTGVDNFSHVKFYFDPSYQELMVHQIRIYRDGQWSDRMNSSTSKLIQNENDLDKNLYNGELCLVYFLDDLRVGDVLDFSCSFIGENPAFSSHFNRVFSLQEEAAVEKIYRRIVGHPSQQLFFKPFNIQIEPQISELSPHLKEWVWEASSTVPYLEEDNEPDWYNPMARVHISQYKT